ncbi:hypothetical protein J4480_02960 [Candidatus Woesearchaeota archaeon]|nr:hypothetical protein [Candidatus Woesearchaeota archaeon]
MIKRIILLVLAFSLILSIVNSQPCGTSNKPCNNWANFDYGNPNAIISNIPPYELNIDKVLQYNREEELKSPQIEPNLDRIPNLKQLDFTELRNAVQSVYSVDIADINKGASLVGGLLKSTFGVQDQLDLSNKAGWAIKINDDGRIVVTNGEISGTQIKDGDKFTISKARLNVNLKMAEVEELSFKDGNYYVKQGDIASIDSYKINALSTDVLVNFDGGQRLELLKIQTELNDALKESKKVWTGKVQDLYNQRESLKSILGLSQSSSSQILTGIYGSSQNSVVFGDNSILVNGNGFSVTDGVKVVTPQGGNILSIARDSQPTLYNLIKGKGGINNGNFVYGLGEKKDTISVNQFLSADKPKEDIEISNEQTATIVSPKGQNEIIVQKGQTASQLVGGYKKAIEYDVVYTFPDGTSKRGPEVDFEKLPIGTRISFDPDFSGNTVEVSNNPQSYSQRIENSIKSGVGEVAKKYPSLPFAPQEFKAVTIVESGQNLNEKCDADSCGIPKIRPPAINEVNQKFGTEFRWADIKDKKMSPEEQTRAGALFYGIVKNNIYNACAGCDANTKLELTWIGYNMGYPTVTSLISMYEDTYGAKPTAAEFKDFLTVENLRTASPKEYGNNNKWSPLKLKRKIDIVRAYPDKVRRALR